MIDETEIQKLARRYGNPRRAKFEFHAVSPAFRDWVRRLTRRRGEIILVVPRGSGQVLLHTKAHYPEGVYRLPTGGIHKREEIDAAARREVLEEMGFDVNALELLGILENVFRLPQERLEYPSFVFRTQEFLRTPNPTDPDEPISGFTDADAMELRVMAQCLIGLPLQWREWGLFRAAAHTWLADYMQK